MDFTAALLLIGTVFAFVQFVKNTFPGLAAPVTNIVTFVAGIVLTLLVAHSDFGSTQLVNHLALSDMNTASLLVVGLVIGSGGTVLHNTFETVKNVGANQDPPS